MEGEFVLYGAIEAGGTKFVCAVGDRNFEVTQKVSFPTRTPEETMNKVYEFFNRYNLKSIGIGSFGPIDLIPESSTYGYIKNTPKDRWKNFDFLGSLKAKYDIPIGWSTDVNIAALGEAIKGAGKGLDNILYLTVGTGIGGGAIIKGNILEGVGHPEMGHIMIKPHPDDKFEGLCPFHSNCLEGMASGPTIEARLGKKGKEICNTNVVWVYLADYIAQALFNYTLILSPNKIILGGGVMKNMYLVEQIKNKLKEKLDDYITIPPINQYITTPNQGDDCGIIGGFILADRVLKKVCR